MMYFNQYLKSSFLALYDFQQVVSINTSFICTVNLCYLQLLAIYKKKIELNNCNQSQIQMFLNIRCFQVGWNTPAFLKECFILPKILFGS